MPQGIGSPRVELEAWSAVWDHAGDGILFVARSQRQDHRDKYVIGHHGARTEHLRAADYDAVFTLGSHACIQIGLGLLVRRLGAVDGGMDDDVADVEILVRSLGSEAQKIVGKLLPAPRKEVGGTGEAREKRRDMVRRAAEETIGSICPEFDRVPARDQVVATAWHQP